MTEEEGIYSLPDDTVLTVASPYLPGVTFQGDYASLTVSLAEGAEEDSLMNSLVTLLMAVPEVPAMWELLNGLGLKIDYTEIEDET